MHIQSHKISFLSVSLVHFNQLFKPIEVKYFMWKALSIHGRGYTSILVILFSWQWSTQNLEVLPFLFAGTTGGATQWLLEGCVMSSPSMSSTCVQIALRSFEDFHYGDCRIGRSPPLVTIWCRASGGITWNLTKKCPCNSSATPLIFLVFHAIALGSHRRKAES